MSNRSRYAVYGAVFGVLFPLAALAALAVDGGVRASNPVSFLGAAHQSQQLLWMIDTAPLFLGLFASLAGARQDRLHSLTDSLEVQVAGKTESLVAALAQAERLAEAIAHLAAHDPLTGLLSRHRFEEELDYWSQHATRYRHSIAYIFIDLDRFKAINDTLGHSCGGMYLTAVGQLLGSALRATDRLGRWGGDEFAVLMPKATEATATAVAEKIVTALATSDLTLNDRVMRASASIGIALLPAHATSAAGLLDCADRAMYEAKQLGGGHWRLSQPLDGHDRPAAPHGPPGQAR